MKPCDSPLHRHDLNIGPKRSSILRILGFLFFSPFWILFTTPLLSVLVGWNWCTSQFEALGWPLFTTPPHAQDVMRCFNLQLALVLFLTQCTIVSSAPQRFADRINSAKSAASLASLETATATNNAGGDATATATSSGSQTAAVTNTAGSTSTTDANGGASASSTGTNTATSTQVTVTSTDGNSIECSETPEPNTANTSRCGGGASDDDGNPGSNSGTGNGNGNGNGNSGSGSDSDSDPAAQNQSNRSSLSQGQLAAVITLPILAFLAIVFCLFWFCRRRGANWWQARTERGAYLRTLDDPVMSYAGAGANGKQKTSGPRFRENLMRPLSFGFSQPADQSIRRKPLNWDANNIGTSNGFGSIGMAVPMPDNGDEIERTHLRNQSEVSEAAGAGPEAEGNGAGRSKSLGGRSIVSAMSSDGLATRVDALPPAKR